MTIKAKKEKLKEFKNENEFREFLIDFLTKCGFKNILHTHRYGSPEQGKDIIGRIENQITGVDWFAFVVKKGRVSGGTNEIETIKNQISQSFEYPYKGINGEKIKINKVVVITNENFTNGAQSQINESPRLSSYNNFNFWWNENLIPKIDENYPDFWLPGDAFAKEYSKNFISQLKKEIRIRDFTIPKVDDKKIQKLLDIFIEPKLTVKELEEDKKTKEKTIKNKKFNIKALEIIDENLLLSGEQGVGKTKLLNNLARRLADSNLMYRNKQIPVIIKALQLREYDFNIEELIKNLLKKYSDIFFDEETLKEYRIVPFVDDFDLLRNSEKEKIKEGLEKYCDNNSTNFILTYSKDEINFSSSIKSIKIHSFNNKQIESFINKFFESTDKAKKFYRILNESDILSKLPTTPLTISLISLLYDENNFEIPATLSDIYTDFVNVLLGRLEVYNKTDLLIYNLKKRIFTSLALKMLDERNYEIRLIDFILFVNEFLSDRSYETQSESDILEIIEKSGLLYITDKKVVGFKQQAFIEFLASVEIYHHKRESHYEKLIINFNDVTWQNTTIFYAGHSKELQLIIDDVINKSPNENIKDWLINSSGMGYLSQALYQTKPVERKKLVMKALDNLILCYDKMKEMTSEKGTFLYDMPLPLLLGTLNHWFNENFKSITLKGTLNMSFEEVFNSENNFENNFKGLMIATTLMNPYINDEENFSRLIDRQEFISHPILPLVADFSMELGMIHKRNVNKDLKKKIEDQIKKKREYIKHVLKEPAYRFNENFALKKKE
ncbi:hypothetical protein C8N46_112133 [Kordia periserrulae]|uniref:Restriction endonuclease n=1 Tax=Kordia periserrulae TaxID=701523 RepID=A0A2T6BRX0_9FLAO|nr:hypothetical protein [Kordia periserrulae]PTX58825.1 hypothetical protein C8N46_112133 [Kordia periserrulae]